MVFQEAEDSLESGVSLPASLVPANLARVTFQAEKEAFPAGSCGFPLEWTAYVSQAVGRGEAPESPDRQQW